MCSISPASRSFSWALAESVGSWQGLGEVCLRFSLAEVEGAFNLHD